jgi:nicotinamide-nucleotide amidase
MDEGVATATESPEAGLFALAERLQARCIAANLTVSTAESCTGGLVAHLITQVSGSSGYLLGGVVAYSDAVKVSQLAVPQGVLDAHGAVSAQVARAMAEGARASFATSLAVSITGIAGPDGGTPAKPVGLTYLAVASPAETEVRRMTWAGDRNANKWSSARLALEMLLAGAEAAADTDATAAGAPDGSASEPAEAAARS